MKKLNHQPLTSSTRERSVSTPVTPSRPMVPNVRSRALNAPRSALYVGIGLAGDVGGDVVAHVVAAAPSPVAKLPAGERPVDALDVEDVVVVDEHGAHDVVELGVGRPRRRRSANSSHVVRGPLGMGVEQLVVVGPADLAAHQRAARRARKSAGRARATSSATAASVRNWGRGAGAACRR